MEQDKFVEPIKVIKEEEIPTLNVKMPKKRRGETPDSFYEFMKHFSLKFLHVQEPTIFTLESLMTIVPGKKMMSRRAYEVISVLMGTGLVKKGGKKSTYLWTGRCVFNNSFVIRTIADEFGLAEVSNVCFKTLMSGYEFETATALVRFIISRYTDGTFTEKNLMRKVHCACQIFKHLNIIKGCKIKRNSKMPYSNFMAADYLVENDQ